ncbi:hypothetical protein M758_1G255200 [Ceratodon purpureus]|nr:hypothetical protein M758_1G255200 [Ceratodon purpureus]
MRPISPLFSFFFPCSTFLFCAIFASPSLNQSHLPPMFIHMNSTVIFMSPR